MTTILSSSQACEGIPGKANKVKVTIDSGARACHTEIGEDVLKSVLGYIEGAYVMEKLPSMEGRFMSMILAPKSPRKPIETKPVDGE
jgi:translation initiation factor IF-3